VIIILTLVLLCGSFLIVCFWKKRPILALILASLLAILAMTIPSLVQTFQALMIYGTGDPQLMAGGISEAIVSVILAMCVVLPLLILFQVVTHRRWKAKLKAEDALTGFE